MRTISQDVGAFGEEKVTKLCRCPRCKRDSRLYRLPKNFKCADVICDFCGFLAQVKAATTENVSALPSKIMGAAWGPQLARMEAGIYFPLYLVLVSRDRRAFSIHYLPVDLQERHLFEARNELSPTARKAGWRGFRYNLKPVHARMVRLYPSNMATNAKKQQAIVLNG